MTTVTQFRAVRRASGTVDDDLYDVNPLREAFNRFDSGVSALFTDDDGTKLDSYPYGQRVEIQYSTDGGMNWTERFEGFVADATRTTKDGFPAVVPDSVYKQAERLVQERDTTIKEAIRFMCQEGGFEV